MSKLDEAIDALVADERVTATVKALLLDAFREKLRGLGFEIVPIAKDAEQDDTTARAAEGPMSESFASSYPKEVCPVCGTARQDFQTDHYWQQSVVSCGRRRAIKERISLLHDDLERIKDEGWGH